MTAFARHTQTRGAALVTAIATLTVLLVIALSFFTSTRLEQESSINVVSARKGELLVDSAFAVATAFLNHDLIAHPTVTSVDHAWKTYFNGSWAVGKPWMWMPLDIDGDGDLEQVPLTNGGIPEVNLPSMPSLFVDGNLTEFRMHSGEQVSTNFKYIPRIEIDGPINRLSRADLAVDGFLGYDPVTEPFIGTDDDGDGLTDENPFVTSHDFDSFVPAGGPFSNSTPIFGLLQTVGVNPGADPNLDGLNNPTALPQEQIHFWTDVDNNEDGFNDSIWLPASADRQFPNDGIDNDLDGFTDENDPDGDWGIFLYEGGADGLDNDGDGEVDEADENRVFLTAQLLDALPGNPNPLLLPTLTFEPTEAFPNGRTIQLNAANPEDRFDLSAPDVIDNDYDLIANEQRVFFIDFANPTNPQFSSPIEEARAHHLIAPFYLANSFYQNGQGAVFAMGEAVSEITGRMAIYITDEAGKVNMNVAGGKSINDFPFTDFDEPVPTDFAVVNAFHQGVTPHEYDLRVLPAIGTKRADRLWNLRMGGPNGTGFISAGSIEGRSFPEQQIDLNPNPSDPFFFDFGNFGWDVSAPGYGRVDDNGNLLNLALNQIDDLGFAPFYQSDDIDNDLDGLVDEAGEGEFVAVNRGLLPFDYTGDGNLEFALFEGIDEPHEYQSFRPLRNLVAEADGDLADGIDGDLDGVVDDATSAGNPRDGNNDNDFGQAQVEIVDEIGEFGDTYFRSEELVRRIILSEQRSFELGEINFLSQTPDSFFALLKPFITVYATAKNDRYRFSAAGSVNALLDPEDRAISGLKLDYNYAPPRDIALMLQQDWGYAPTDIPLQPEAITLFARGLKTEGLDIVVPPGSLGVYNNAYQGTAQVLPSDPALRARQIALNIRDARDPDHARTEETFSVTDEWWQNISGQPPTQPRQINYTAAGTESIRINEIMVRAVRRMEAEADFATPAFDPNVFFSASFPQFDYASNDFSLADPPQLPNAEGWNLDSNLTGSLGEKSFLFTTQNTFDHDNNGGTDEIPNAVQYVFQATPGLPAGRYYLTLNTSAFNDDGSRLVTVNESLDIEFAIKYFSPGGGGTTTNTLGQTITVGDQDILSDIAANDTDDDFIGGGLNSIWNRETPQIGFENMDNKVAGTESGWVFLPGNEDELADPLNQLPLLWGYSMDQSFTVEVPEAGTYFLCVAIRMGTDFMGWGNDGLDNDGDGLFDEGDEQAGDRPLENSVAVNFFDFSQEPDHEWVEIVNIAESDEPIDLSGWQLVVEGNEFDEGRLPMTIPPGTLIAPGGSLLLGTNKFDTFHPLVNIGIDGVDNDGDGVIDEDDEKDLFKRNGIGLARGTLFPDTGPQFFQNVTVPPIFSNVDTEFGIFPIGSVFNRPNDFTDYVDNDGDGVRDAGTSEDFVQSTPVEFGLDTPTKAWDRIVELDIDILENAGDAGDIAEIVLAGGIFPNYPERDGLDNDADNGVLERDGVDNDGDGVIDEGGEGIDEGRWVSPAPGVLDASIPATFPKPGSYDLLTPLAAPTPYVFTFNDPDLGPVTNIFGDVGAEFFIGAASDYPEWKAFAERRWYPGDNVVITLRDTENNVVDRVTYNELDVINRAVDDILPIPEDAFGNLVRTPLNRLIPDGEFNNFTSAWPADTMGIDFYRSLERKHPLYHGDRFGVQNRWQATDGAYDDWAASTSVWERVVAPDGTTTVVSRFEARAEDGVDDPEPDFGEPVVELFAHAISGSPLRANFPHRYIENLSGQFTDGSEPVNLIPESVDYARNVRWAFARGAVRNRQYVSPGDVVRVPHYERAKFLDTVQDTASLNQSLFAPNSDLSLPSSLARIDDNTEAVLIGQPTATTALAADRMATDRAALVHNAAMAPVELTVAQAEVFPFVPFESNVGVGDMDELAQWANNGSETNGVQVTYQYPQVWAPVLGFALLPDEVDPTSPLSQFASDVTKTPDLSFYQARYLFNRPGILPTTVLPDRWPLERRAVMYVSGNVPDFEPGFSPHANGVGAEILFMWDGEDGLENGEYDVYLAMAEDLGPLGEANDLGIQRAGNQPGFLPLLLGGAQTGSPNFDILRFGLDFINTAVPADPDRMVVDVELFTDRDGDRRVWTDTGVAGPQQQELNRDPAGPDGELGTNDDILSESFGMLQDVAPGADGYLRYGVVRVENNRLALFLRNRASPGVLNRFSRLILTPRNKTPGRLNINTVATQTISNNDGTETVFNPIMGVPGMLEWFGFEDGTLEQQFVAPEEPISDALVNLVPSGFGTVRQINDIPVLDIGPPTPLPLSVDNDPHTDPDFGQRVLDSALGMTRHLLKNRPEHADGRYYDFSSELFSGPSGNPLSFLANSPLFTGSEADNLSAFNEVSERFSRISNSVTTRSDVFEIIVTVQPGSGFDANNDGRINYRSDEEFIPTGEKKARVVYER